MAKVNEMVFSVRNFDSPAKMWESISQFLRIIIENEYVATVEYEDCGIYVVRYDNGDPAIGGPLPYWLDADEYGQFQDCLLSIPKKNEDDK